MKFTSKNIRAGLAVWLLAMPAFAGSTNAPAGPALRVMTDYIEAEISLAAPGFASLSVDSLGGKRFSPVPMSAPAKPEGKVQAMRNENGVEYRGWGANPSETPGWLIEIKTKEIRLESHWSVDDSPEPLVLRADSNVSHLTLLGLVETNGAMPLPALLHFPDQGSLLISASQDQAEPLGYAATRRDVTITFPAATREHPALTYRLRVTAIYPAVPGISGDPRFDGFRRDWLNIFQINPQRRMLANNSGSDTCGFCYYEYGDIARATPPLAGGMSALDMVRQTLDQIIGGAKVCGMPGYTRGHEDRPECTADTLPSFLIAAEDYVAGGHAAGWLATNYDQLKSWTDQMLATDHDGDGLIKYMLSGNSGSWPEKIKYRPANWWDTIGFGHEDAYANALAWRALGGMAELAERTRHPGDRMRYLAAANKLKAAYFPAFYDPATGVLAGWRSADGQLHDYYFPWVNGIAIHYGLVPRDRANAIMDLLLAKMNAVGFTNFALGLPGNLIPVARNDYVDHHRSAGGGNQADGSDGFQIYENGGATACFAGFTLAALYDLGRVADGDRMLFPMLDAFARGDFQGRDKNGLSKDWRKWDGTGQGYEGMLTDNYYTLLTVLDRAAAIKARQKTGSKSF